jgi:ribosomal protein S18 acetylase RimI-like enzyme
MDAQMKMTHRTYADEASDFQRLCRFVVAYHDHMRAYSTWSLGRLVDWKYGLYENKLSVAGFCDKNAHLWFDGFGELAGVAISENGDTGFAVITANVTADIERICTHSCFRKRGFARAVIQECLDRLREMGMCRAYITGYSHEAIALYGSLGAAEQSKMVIYETAAS